MAGKSLFIWILALTLLFTISQGQQEDTVDSTGHPEINPEGDVTISPEPTVPEGCDPNIPNLSVGIGIAKTAEELREFKKNNKVYFLGISSSVCEKCCQGEVILDQVHRAFTDGEVAYKKKPIPVIRIDVTTFQGDLLEEEGLDVQKVPKFAFHLNGVTHEYAETFHKTFILHYINRKLYPVVLLKTEDEINSFINPEKEWFENTPFYQEDYIGFAEYFPKFRKITRVIAFINDKRDFADEIKQLKDTALLFSGREDLRVAKVTDKKLVTKYKKMYNLEWFSEVSSNSIVMIKKDHDRSSPIIKYYDLNTQTELFTEWINQNSLEPLEEISGFSFKIISHLKKPMFMAFVNRNHKEYGKESVQLLKILEEIAPKYPQYIFTFTEEDRYRDTKKELEITWDEEPSLSLNHVLTEGSTVFPRGKPFTKRNVIYYINSIIDGRINSKHFKLPDSKKEYVKYLKNVKKIKKNKFAEVAMDQDKDVAILFIDSENIDDSVERVIKAYGKAAKRFNELKIKSVKLAVFDTAKQATPDGFDLETDKSSSCRLFILPSAHKHEPYQEIEDLSTQEIMTEIQKYADKSFDLPEFPHLDEIEMYQLESGSYHEDL
ncbi:unnamed protein product [Moneuplotes crassus]|uniref:Protein disulfide isomerase n=1 Tax=Euplotes crassus TaxID=5936 RepID=A0AAD1X3E8_EUPCR|nr:unnamed protein product [Moneuplotes crassus]